MSTIIIFLVGLVLMLILMIKTNWDRSEYAAGGTGNRYRLWGISV